MAYNVPVYDTARITFGPGRLYLGAVGVTPTIEIGAVKGDATLSIKRKTLDVMQGSPQTIIEQYVTQEEVSLKVTGIEWNTNGLQMVLGAGITANSAGVETLEFGGDMKMSKQALLFRHISADGSTIDIEMYNVEGSGEIEVGIKETDVHEFPYEFVALEGTTNFAAAALAAKKKYFKIKRTVAA